MYCKAGEEGYAGKDREVGKLGKGGRSFIAFFSFLTYSEHYIRDAQGNIMAVYKYTNSGTASTKVVERPIDGGSCTGCVDHRYKKLRYTYDLISGNVLRVDYGTGDDQMHHRYAYDADNRITAVETSADAVVWHRDAEYFYYPHGPLQRVELGEHKVQGMDYAYTLQGWLKGINSDRLTPETDMGQDGLPGTANALVARDAYGESIGYYGDEDFSAIDAARWDNSGGNRSFAPVGTSGTLSAAYNPLYNGNIAHTVNSLQPWGGWTSPTQPAQVLAQVYRYDQLNRLKQAQGVEGLTSANTWDGITDAVADRYKSQYTYDANGNIETVARFDETGTQYDNLQYHYEKNGAQLLRNRLYHLNETIDGGYGDIGIDASTFHAAHADVNALNNYKYDELGNLIADKREEIANIEWTVSGKVKHITRTAGSTKPELWFTYGADGQRTSKTVGDPDNGGYREHYIRDAQGNIMAVYKYTNSGTASTKVVERPVYGSSRLGSYALAQEVMGTWLSTYPFTQLLSNPDKRYELTDHLGNVNTVVSGRLLDGAGAGSPKQAEVITASGYEPFGALLPGRNWRQPLGPPPPPVTPQGTLVITEFSNGPSGDCEYVELYVTKCSLYPDATEVDIRGWIVDDNGGNLNSEGGCTTGVGISSGHLRLAAVATWASVPVGSVIVLYNGNDNCYAFTAQEAGTGGQYFVNVNSTTLIERTGSGGTPSTSDCGYCDNSYTATSSSPSSWSTIAMGNSGDGIQVRCPDCPESEAGFFHGVGYGSGFGSLTAGANDLGGAYMSGPGGGRTYELTGAGVPGDGANWTRISAPAGGTPPSTVGVVAPAVASWIEGTSLPCCGSFEAPVLAQKQGYRFGFNGKENDNEWHGAVGTMQDYGLRAYDTRVARFFAVDPLAPQYPMLTPYQFASNMPIWAVDLDGAEAWVYTETDGVGHAFIVVPSSDDVKELVVYSYGRYNGSSTPSLGGFGPVGDGVLIKKEGQSAKEYIRERLSLDNGKSTFVFEFPKADAEKIRNYFDAQFNNGTPLPTGSKAEQKYGDEAKVVDQYIIAPMFGQKASNCVTKTCAGIERGGSLDEFTPVGDGGAYIDLRNQIDPKVMGGLLWMMGRQDAADNPNNRNVIDVTDQQKNDYGIAPK